MNFFGTNTEDCDGHGTQVAGIIGGATYGVAKNATLVPVKFWCANSSAAFAVATLEWAIGNHPSETPGVINVSCSGVNFPPELIELALSRNLLIVAAAGNTDGATCATPASDAKDGSAILWFAKDDRQIRRISPWIVERPDKTPTVSARRRYATR